MSVVVTDGFEAGSPAGARAVVVGVTVLAIVALVALLVPEVGAIGVGTLLALVVAVLATRSALRGHRDRRLR